MQFYAMQKRSGSGGLLLAVPGHAAQCCAAAAQAGFRGYPRVPGFTGCPRVPGCAPAGSVCCGWALGVGRCGLEQDRAAAAAHRSPADGALLGSEGLGEQPPVIPACRLLQFAGFLLTAHGAATI